jgi:hypothetical protein
VKKKKQELPNPEDADRLRERMDRCKNTMENMRVAFYNRTPFDGKVPEYEDVRSAAENFIAANYDYQKALWGKVKVKLSVANLLR